MEEKQQLAPRLTLSKSITVSVCARELCGSTGPMSIQLSSALAGLCHHSRVSERPDSDRHVTPVRRQVAPAMPGYLGSKTGKASPGSRCLASTETQTRLLVTAGQGGSAPVCIDLGLAAVSLPPKSFNSASAFAFALGLDETLFVRVI